MMMKNIVVVALLLGLTAQASADNKKVWKGVFVGSLVMAGGGGYLWWSGTNDVNDAREALCDGGAYPSDPSCPTPSTLTPAQLHALNEQGDRGSMKSNIGAATFVLGGGLAVYSFYKGFIQKDKAEPKVVVAPAVTRGGAGAALQLRW